MAPPIYALVRARSDAGSARLAALVVWIYPPLAGLVFGDFHENGFAPAAVAWTLYAFDAGLPALTFAGALVTLSVKEDQAVFLTIAGAIGACHFRGTPRGRARRRDRGDRRTGLRRVLCIHSAACGAGRGTQAWQPWRFYAWNAVAAHSWTAEIGARLGFLLLILAPLLFLPFRSKWMWLAAAPLAEVLSTRMSTTFTVGTHYTGAWAGYLLAAFAFAVRELAPRRAHPALIACIALCAIEFTVADPLHPGINLRGAQPRDAVLDDS